MPSGAHGREQRGERGVDVVIVDTAGRLHTKAGLMDELGKIKRVISRHATVDEVLTTSEQVAQRAKGVGDARFQAELRAATLGEPVVVQQSTSIYAPINTRPLP